MDAMEYDAVLERQEKEIERLRAALADIIDPIAAMQRDLEDGCRLDGAMAVTLASRPEHYKNIARKALAGA